MDTIFLYNQRKESFPTEVIRYFNFNGQKYFIFTLNEKDDNGYIQLYVARIENEYGKLSMDTITDENEWTNFKKEIQKIVVNNRNGVGNTTDLDYNELNNMTVTQFRVFKLKESVAQELGQNKKVISIPDKKEPATLEAASAQTNDLTIEEILNQVSMGAKNAKEIIPVKIDTDKKEISDEKSLENSNDSSTIKDLSFEEILQEKSANLSVADKEENQESEISPVENQESKILSVENQDEYKKKYDDLLKSMKELEAENIRLINELVREKAKVQTVKDIVND